MQKQLQRIEAMSLVNVEPERDDQKPVVDATESAATYKTVITLPG